MRTLVLDLRGNPGGLLNVAVEIAERFIDQGVIVSTRGRAPGQSQVLRASGQGPLADAAVRPGRPRQRQRQRDPRRRPEGPPPGHRDRRAELRQGLGAEHLLAPLGPRRPEADDRQVLLAPNRPYSEQGVTPDLPIKTRVAAKPVEKDKDAEPLDEAMSATPSSTPSSPPPSARPTAAARRRDDSGGLPSRQRVELAVVLDLKQVGPVNRYGDGPLVLDHNARWAGKRTPA